MQLGVLSRVLVSNCHRDGAGLEATPGPRPVVGRRLHLPALLGRRHLLELRRRRLQPPRRRLAARWPHATTLVLDALRMALGPGTSALASGS